MPDPGPQPGSGASKPAGRSVAARSPETANSTVAREGAPPTGSSDASRPAAAGATDPAGETKPPSARVRIHDALVFSLAAVLLGIWLSVHVSPWVSQATVWYGAGTLVTLAAAFLAWIKWALGEELKRLPGLLFNTWRLTKYYWTGLLIAAVLLLTTRSVYFTHSASGHAAVNPPPPCRIQWGFSGSGLKEEILSEENKSTGRPFLFQLRPRVLTVEVLDPPLYQARPPERVWPWGNRLIEVPSAFKTREFHLVRVLPGPRLINKQLAPGAGEGRKFSIALVANGQTCEAQDVRWESVVFGADSRQLAWALDRESHESRDSVFQDLLHPFSVEPEMANKMLKAWQKARQHGSMEFKGKETVELILKLDGEVVQSPKSIKVSESPGVQNEILEINP